MKLMTRLIAEVEIRLRNKYSELRKHEIMDTSERM